MKIWQRAVLGVFLVVAGINLAFWFWVTDRTCAGDNLTIDVPSHRVHPTNCHGTIHYLTPFENTLLHWLIPGQLVLLIGLSTLKRRWSNIRS